jgi:Arc/MetJ-type ribon-helix-helix transcriptional regulator
VKPPQNRGKRYGVPMMNLEIRKPELAQRVQARIQSGRFHDADELIEKVLDALDEQATAAEPPTATGAVVLATLQARPYRTLI